MKFTDEDIKRIKMSKQVQSDTDSLLICQLVDEVEKLRDNRKSLTITYVELLIDYFELLDDHFPEWRIHCKSNIKKLLERIEGGK